jgi:hypothetical protein
MPTHYRATLTDSAFEDQRAIAAIEATFRSTLEEALGGVQAVVNARQAYLDVFERYQTLPLPATATYEEREAVRLWEDAEEEAVKTAFALPFAFTFAFTLVAYFEIILW